MSDAVVVGGGISGLAAARRLARAGLSVTVCEASPRWGGKISAVHVGGLSLDGGAESMLARRSEGTALIADLGLGGRQTHPTSARPRLLIEGREVGLPPSLQGVPTDPPALAPLLTGPGLAYALTEPDRPAPPLTGDVSIGDYVAARFGPEVTDRLLEPLLGGVYAGRSRELSFAAVAPPLFAAARGGGSLTGHARAALRPSGGPVFAGLTGGVHGLIQALTGELEALGVQLRPGTAVTALSPNARGYTLSTPAGRLEAGSVVLAAPAAATGRLLDGLVPAAADLSQVPYASTAVLTLLVRQLAPSTSGLLVPPGELPTVKALTYSAAKWTWVAEAVEQAYGPGVTAVRVSVGRAGEAALLQLDDDALLRRSVSEVGTLPSWEGATVLAGAVTRWGGALPQYVLGHGSLIARLRTELSGRPGLAVAGAMLDGVGIPACLASADLAADKVLAELNGAPGTDRIGVLGAGGRIDVPTS